MSCVQEGGVMNEKDIRKYAALMKELELTGLEITDGDKKVRLERQISSFSVPVSYDSEKSGKDGQSVSEASLSADYISVTSPMVGVFYSSPQENGAPYVKEGDRVKKGQILCVIEAMKLMNEIFAKEDGIIEKVMVENGQTVQFGTELFRIKR